MTEHIYDTTFLQLTSVVRFAEELGWGFNGRSFTSYIDGRTEYYSFKDMQAAHNGVWKHSLDFASTVGIGREIVADMWEYRAARGMQLVQTSKLQYHKKLRRFVAQSHMVELL